MKRSLIIITVIVAHLLLLFWFFGCRDRQARRTDSGASLTAPSPAASVGDESDGTPPPTTGRPQAGTDSSRRTTAAGVKSLTQVTLTPVDLPLPASIATRTSACRTGLLVDWTNRRILWRKQPDQAVPIASMTKMMTALLVMEHIARDPMIDLNSRVRVTRTAAAVGGRQVWLDPRESLTVDELLKCTMVRSANDTAYLLAEFLSGGNVPVFVRRMNDRAAELGLSQMRFTSPHGLPSAPGTVSDQATARELAYLGAYLLDFPQIVKWSSTRLAYIREQSSEFKPFQLVNSNHLVESVPGVNGMKTGYTQEAGYCTTVTCERSRRVMIVVLTGCSTAKERDALAKDLLEWGYRL